MRNILIGFFLLVLSTYVCLAQTNIIVPYPNTNTIVTLNPTQIKALVDGGFSLDVNFSIPAGRSNSHIFELQINDVAVLRVSKVESRLSVRRNVKWQPCLNWVDTVCVNWGVAELGNDIYTAWDDSLFNNPDGTAVTSGHLSYTLANNAMKIRVGTIINGNESFKCDLSYEGLSFSRLLSQLQAAFSANSSVKIAFYSADQLTLSNANIYLQVNDVTANALTYPELNFRVNGYAAGRVGSECGCSEAEVQNQKSDEKDFTLYPVPVENRITLQTNLAKSSVSEFTIVDLNGKEVETFEIPIEQGMQTTELSIDRSRIIAGVYVFRFRSNSKLFTGKLVVK